MLTEHTLCYRIFSKIKTYPLETWTLTERDSKQLNVFERKVYRILGAVYDKEKESWMILTDKQNLCNCQKTYHNRDSKAT
jgi:hypothetical protein